MQHQTHTTTHLNRYPKIFNYVANNFLHLKNILSFGCSSGEECFTLKEYFKGSNIYGVDTNSDALNKALKNNNEKSISFSKSLDEVPMVDCIFAMSVFCKWPETDGLIKNNIYSFEHFNQEINNLDKLISSGGLFIIFNSNYYFLDTEQANKYNIINGDFEEEFVRKFDKKGNYSKLSSPIIFVKK